MTNVLLGGMHYRGDAPMLLVGFFAQNCTKYEVPRDVKISRLPVLQVVYWSAHFFHPAILNILVLYFEQTSLVTTNGSPVAIAFLEEAHHSSTTKECSHCFKLLQVVTLLIRKTVNFPDNGSPSGDNGNTSFSEEIQVTWYHSQDSNHSMAYIYEWG